jgi:hypothetical protein
MDVTVIADDGKNGSDGVVRGVCFNGNLSAWNPMMKYRCRGESQLESVESGLAFLSPTPRNTRSGKPSEWNGDSGIVVDETSVEVAET